MSTAEKIGRYIRYKREKSNLSLNEFARRCNLTASFILRLESGFYKTVKFDIVEKLAQGMYMPVEDFLSKCDILHRSSDALPPLDHYLREVYQFPDEAVNDVKMFLSLLEGKYKEELKHRRDAHDHYWNNLSTTK